MGWLNSHFRQWIKKIEFKERRWRMEYPKGRAARHWAKRIVGGWWQYPGTGVSSLYAVTGGKLSWSWSWVGGLGMQIEWGCTFRCFKDSFNFLYGLIPGVQQVFLILASCDRKLRQVFLVFVFLWWEACKWLVRIMFPIFLFVSIYSYGIGAKFLFCNYFLLFWKHRDVPNSC